MKQVSDDPIVRAQGYLWAADGNTGTALYLLPNDHPEAEKLAKLIKSIEKMHNRLSDGNPDGDPQMLGRDWFMGERVVYHAR